jgi:hypothetical protein
MVLIACLELVNCELGCYFMLLSLLPGEGLGHSILKFSHLYSFI